MIRRDVLALWLAARDPRVPWAAKAVCGVIAAYALSPIDLIPDFIPVLGQLDEVLILPPLIVLAIRLVSATLMAEFRAEAAQRLERPTSRAGAIAIACLWLAAAVLVAWLLWPGTG